MFANRALISMEAAPKQKDLEYSLLREWVGGKERRGICSAVIYGPNAAGKSALVSAVSDFRGIVSRGSVSAAGSGRDFSLVPSSFAEAARPVSFEVAFTRGGILYEYRLMADLGRFAQPQDVRQVLAESLRVDGADVFARDGGGISISVPTSLEPLFARPYLDNRSVADSLLSTVAPEDLFLVNGFRTIVSPDIAGEVIAWFSDDLMVISRANEMSVYPKPTDARDDGAVGTHFTEAARLFGTSSRNSLVFLRQEGSEDRAELYTAVVTPHGPVAVPSSKYESLGTTRFLNMLPFIELALTEGKVLVIDELDASIHPMAVMSIVNAFHDDGVNVRRAQLVFTTHNPVLLDGSLFRRDEIKFVEPDEETGESVTYALSDFGTAGARGVRRGEDYLRGYFMGRYGGIRDIDFVPFLKEQVGRGLRIDLTPDGKTSDGRRGVDC